MEWQCLLTEAAIRMLEHYTRGIISTNEYDPVKSISVSSNVHECSEVFFKSEGLPFLSPNLASGKAVYKPYV